jgi:hypothetical protein
MIATSKQASKHLQKRQWLFYIALQTASSKYLEKIQISGCIAVVVRVHHTCCAGGQGVTETVTRTVADTVDGQQGRGGGGGIHLRYIQVIDRAS